MNTKLVEEENTVYEVDEDCLKAKQNHSEKTVEMDDILEGMLEKTDCHKIVESDYPPLKEHDCQKKDSEKGNHHCCLWLILLFFCCKKR